MKKYKVRAEETIYAIYETEIEAKNEKETKKIPVTVLTVIYLSSDWSNSAGDFTIEDIEEIE